MLKYFVDYNGICDHGVIADEKARDFAGGNNHGDHPHFCAASSACARRNFPDFLNEPRPGLPFSLGELVRFSQGLVRGDRRADPCGQILATGLLSPLAKSSTREDSVGRHSTAMLVRPDTG